MEFGYSEKQLEIKAMLRDFAEREIAPILNKMDRAAEAVSTMSHMSWRWKRYQRSARLTVS